MYSDEQVAAFADALNQDRAPGTTGDATANALNIARTVWGAKHKQDFDGQKFVERITETQSANIAEKARALSLALLDTAKRLDELNALRVDG
ncbi:MAG: hypothetical protein ABL931_23775, partial [Usitatibacteraceae bacterium]